MKVLATAFTLVLMSPHSAQADIVRLTPDLLQTVEALAAAARQKNPANPTQAANEFFNAFDAAFGTPSTSATTVLVRKDLVVLFTTPLERLKGNYVDALRELRDFPKTPDDRVILTIAPQTMGAPNIERVVLFHGDRQVPAVVDQLAPREFRNSFGAATRLGAGSVAYPPAVFDGTQPVRLLCFGDGRTVVEWTLSVADAKKVR